MDWLLSLFVIVAIWGLIICGLIFRGMWCLVTISTRNDTHPAASAGVKEIFDVGLDEERSMLVSTNVSAS